MVYLYSICIVYLYENVVKQAIEEYNSGRSPIPVQLVIQLRILSSLFFTLIIGLRQPASTTIHQTYYYDDTTTLMVRTVGAG